MNSKLLPIDRHPSSLWNIGKMANFTVFHFYEQIVAGDIHHFSPLNRYLFLRYALRGLGGGLNLCGHGRNEQHRWGENQHQHSRNPLRDPVHSSSFFHRPWSMTDAMGEFWHS